MPDIDAVQFRNSLLKWYKANKRQLPWRDTGHWYPVFLSEYLLQQTQVEQALPYYEKIFNHFPDIWALARADEHEILSLWAGLGYYNRARNLLKAAKVIVKEYDGNFPSEYKTALELPGIGNYTASAILSIAFDEPLPVVDGNVFRVITRILAISDDIRLTATQKSIRSRLRDLISHKKPGIFNEALMELGATVCKPKNPHCASACPLKRYCLAFQQNEVDRYPYKSPLPEKKSLCHYVLIMKNERRILIVKRPPSGLLASMWEFPVLEVDHFDHNQDELQKLARFNYNIEGNIIKTAKKMTHNYTHIRLQFLPLIISIHKMPEIMNNYVDMRWLHFSELSRYPVHNAHRKAYAVFRNVLTE